MTTPTNNISILMVDDEEDDCKLYTSILSQAGYTIFTAPSLKKAQVILNQHNIGLLLVDLRLPDGHGLKLLTPAQKRDPYVVTVVLTGFASTENAIAALKAGAYDFLTKPCPYDKLLAAINRAAEKYILQKSLNERTRELEEINRTLDHRVQEATSAIFSLNEELKRKVETLVQTNNAQARFVEDMAHELKNPLAVIWGYSTFWLWRPKNEWDHAQQRKSLEVIHRNSQHLQDLIEELLDSSRLASHKIVLNKETFHPEIVLRETVEELRLQANNKKISITIDCPKTNEYMLCADRNRLRQILSNLITNAIKFTPENGRITITAKDEETCIHFCVKDTGIGIPQKYAKKIFDRFFQRKGTTSGNKGLGLGLTIVKGLVKLHGGQVWLNSEPKKGSHFHFTIPKKFSPSADKKLSAPLNEEENITLTSNHFFEK